MHPLHRQLAAGMQAASLFQFQYVKLYMIDNFGDDLFDVSEFEMYVGGINIMLSSNGTAHNDAASSPYNTNYPPEKAIDGSTDPIATNRAIWSMGDAPITAQFDLGVAQTALPDSIVLRNSRTNSVDRSVKEFTVSISNNAIDWTEILSETNATTLRDTGTQTWTL